jgi:hypothetical protein
MSKYTRRFKKNKKNKTIKKGGGDSNENFEERQGIFDILGSKMAGVASSAVSTFGDAGLKMIGLQKIDKVEDKTSKIDENIGKIGDAASGVVSSVENVMDKTGATLFNAANSIIGSNTVKNTTEDAAKETANIVKEGAETFNEALNKPQVKAEVEEA